MLELTGADLASRGGGEGPPAEVLIVGQGYVGLPVAMAAVDAGMHVTGFDLDEQRVRALNRGVSFVEDISHRTVADALAVGRYRVTSDAATLTRFDVAVISVPTPLREGSPDLSFIEAAAQTIAPLLRPGATVILESTTYPGTTAELVVPILEDGSGLKAGPDFHVGYSPERIDPGNRQHTLRSTPKVVSGIDEDSLARVKWFFDQIVDTTVPVSSTQVAEMTKLLENTFRHVNIALVNELAMFANDLGIDVWEAIDAASTKPFGYLRFTPGPGVGGHCLPVDPSYLSWSVRQRLGRAFRFVELANDVNDHMPEYVVARLMRAFNDRGLAIRGRRCLLLGMSYKKNTGDGRESPAARVAAELVALGADVRAADPFVRQDLLPPGVLAAELCASEVSAADVVVVLVDHDAFDPHVVTEHAAFVFDCKRWCTGPTVEHM
jgi:UDP-N-acetyl-D-mannosaminuronic acid dehydrogenase/UDP-N-acetyl-D-glucosamine dehydrogenase